MLNILFSINPRLLEGYVYRVLMSMSTIGTCRVTYRTC